MNEEFIRGELLLWLDYFGTDWVSWNQYSEVGHMFPGELENEKYLESNADIDNGMPRDINIRLTQKGLDLIKEVAHERSA